MAIWIGSSFKEDNPYNTPKVKKSKSVIEKSKLIKDIEDLLDRGNLKYKELDLFKRILKELKK